MTRRRRKRRRRRRKVIKLDSEVHWHEFCLKEMLGYVWLLVDDIDCLQS